MIRNKNASNNYIIGIVLGLLIILCLALLSINIGTADFSLKSIFQGSMTQDQWQILTVSRIPRTISIILAGASMSIAGLILQLLVQNKFVEPSTTGITESSGLGILIVTILFPAASIMTKMIFAVIFSLFGTFLLMQVIKHIKNKSVIVVPLLGMTLSGIIGSFATFIAWEFDLQSTLSAWSLGDFSGILKGRFELLYLVGIVCLLAYFYADKFTLASLGKTMSENLGLNYKQIYSIGLIIVAVVSGINTVVAGSLPFLGMIIPNIVSTIFGDYARKSLPFVSMGGAIFVLVSDILSRTLIAPAEMPVGVIMGVIVSAAFLIILIKSRSSS